MRTSTLARVGAVITASALALSLGAGPVSAAETSTAAAAAAPSAAPSATSFGTTSNVDAAGVITALRLGSGVITDRATTQFLGNIAGQAPSNNVQTQVTINGRVKGRVILYPGQGNGGVEIPRGWGSGKVQLGPTFFSDGTVDQNRSNVFYARKHVTSKATYPLKIHRRNSKVTFKVYGVKIINPSNGKYQSVKRVKLQRSKGGKWRTVKNIKLNSKGNGSYKITNRTKYRYRLYITRSATQEKFSTLKTGKI
ncbi:hypothetical protein [Aeromicrobium wangtongii]|uniref:hypothetical protein n=1 Tax=Aeromicrobium wangtongii TaxID=2969247 RepID=UPI0020178403|nr:hypothetical protein [Aeromicrobium wangtongii]MCL3820336.1 hypothetical protein [Aeromicrobium wangtongii]